MNEIPPLALDSVQFVGSRLARPECVLCTRAGDVFASDRRGGVSHITPDGGHRIYAGATLDLSGPLHPNGIALDRDGQLDRALLDRKSWSKLAHISSIAFAGPQLDMAYLGVLLADSLPRIAMPVRGVPPVHWEWH